MFIFDEGFTNKRFQADQMINYTPFAPETTLKISNKTIAFHKAFQAGSDHAFNSFTKTTIKNNWTVIRWVSIILSRLRNYSDIFPSSWKLTTKAQRKRTSKKRKRKEKQETRNKTVLQICGLTSASLRN